MSQLLVAVASFGLAAQAGAQSDEMPRLKYNSPGLLVDLGVGLWAWPLPMDYDGDGRMDLVVSCGDKPYNGVYLFINSGRFDPDTKLPIFHPGRRFSRGVGNPQVSYVDGKPVVLTPNQAYPDFHNTGFDHPVKLPAPEEIHAPVGNRGEKIRIRANQWRYVDYDGDGVQDLVVGIGDWTDYGWDAAYNEKGEWTNGPLHGYVYLLRNSGSDAKPSYGAPKKVEAGGKAIDVYGNPAPNFADFDGDGDLDLICGEFLDGFTYFENTGTRSQPAYAPGRRLMSAGRKLHTDLCMIVPAACDFDGDGDIDLVVGDEDGRVSLVENTGQVIEGVPQFREPRYFRQYADLVKFGALSSPVSIDWDGDGLEDIVSGNTAGYIGFIKNLGGEPRRWAAPVYLSADGQPIRIEAGPNGSVQGPAEARWGYSNISVADWDGDGLLDILDLGIWGHVVLYRNVGTRTDPQLAAAERLTVAWPGEAPKPAWNWWNPQGDELVTQWRSTPCMIDWNRDGLMDLVTLDPEGYLAFYERRRGKGGKLELLPPQRVFWGDGVSQFNSGGKPAGRVAESGLLRLNASKNGGSGRRTFCFVDWDGDGELDLIVNSQPSVNFLKGLGRNAAGQWAFRDMGPMHPQVIAGHSTTPTVVDWEKDGVPDLLIGAEDGHFYYLRNPRTR